MRVDLDGDEIVIEADTLPEARELGFRHDKRRGAWTAPATRLNATMVLDAIPGASDLRSRLDAPWTGVSDARLYDFQRDAVGWLTSRRHGGIVVLSPGLGKTLVTIRAANELGEVDVLVIAPASLVDNWWDEIEKWDMKVGTTWAVESWDRAARMARENSLGEWDVVVLDESVLGKSRRSQRYRSLVKRRKDWDRVWLLSGNPMTRYADDLWSQLNLVWPRAFPSYWRFTERFCVTEENPWAPHSRKVVGTRRGRNALEENRDLVYVVSQEEVLELPEYRFQTVDVELRPAQQKAYESMASAFIAELGDGTEVVADNELGRLLKLQQIVSWWDGESAKHDAVLEKIAEHEGPHLVWTHWTESADALTRRIPGRVIHISGRTPRKERTLLLREFKQGKVEALVLSIGVGKFGHTFTNVKTIHYVDRTWNADDYFQSLHRVRRIGLAHEPDVIIYRAPGTTDVLVEQNLEGKLTPISRMTRADLATLLRGIREDA